MNEKEMVEWVDGRDEGEVAAVTVDGLGGGDGMG